MKKNDELALLPKTLHDRLSPIGFDIQDQFFTLDQATREVTITRAFISNVYGGSNQKTFPVISPERVAQHGMNDFMFMIPTDYQPEAPQLPGALGLRMCCEPGYKFTQIQRVFVKMVPVLGPKASVYQFVGMYRLEPAVPPYLTVEEYTAQSARVCTSTCCPCHVGCLHSARSFRANGQVR